MSIRHHISSWASEYKEATRHRAFGRRKKSNQIFEDDDSDDEEVEDEEDLQFGKADEGEN